MKIVKKSKKIKKFEFIPVIFQKYEILYGHFFENLQITYNKDGLVQYDRKTPADSFRKKKF